MLTYQAPFDTAALLEEVRKIGLEHRNEIIMSAHRLLGCIQRAVNAHSQT